MYDYICKALELATVPLLVLLFLIVWIGTN
jgi:hypothetical protein